jgi:transposase
MERLIVPQITDILYRLRKGQSERAIARDLHLSRDAVRRYHDFAGKHHLLGAETGLPEETTLSALLGPPASPPGKPSRLEVYRPVIEALLKGSVEKRAIYQRLVDSHGYDGSYSALCRYADKVHPKDVGVTVRIETAPGEQAQVDFGSVGKVRDPKTGRERTAYAFVMTLSWSRHMYVEFVFDQKIATWIRCHRHAFRFFSGCPREIVVDNLKAAVLQHALEDPVLCEPYRKMARHYGFLIHPCRPHTPQHKGKVENGVHYVQRNLVAATDFRDLTDANEKALDWCLNRAGLREHGTTHEQPLKRFRETEQAALLPLPEEPFDLRSVHPAKVHRDCHVVFEGSCYSAPYAYVGKTVDLYAYENIVQLYEGVHLLVTHERATKKGTRVTRLDHYPKEKAQYLERTPEVCERLAKEIGPACSEVVAQLFSYRPADNRRAVQALLRLSEKHGAKSLESACRRALYFQRPLYAYVKNILNAGLADEPLPGETLPPPPQRNYQHARPAADFFPVRYTEQETAVEVATC